MLIYDVGRNGREGTCRTTRLERQDRGRADHDRTRFGLQPGIHNGKFTAPDVLAIPNPGLWIDRLTYRTKQAQTGEIMPGRPLFSKTHQATNRSGRRIENRDLKFLDDAPEAVWLWIGGHAFEQDTRHSVHQRTIDTIAMTCDPTHISGTPIDIVIFYVKDEFCRCVYPY